MRGLLVYVPYLFALSYAHDPHTSYWISWLGSWYILFITLTGIALKKPTDLPFLSQFFRPYIFTQLHFAGYNCLTSPFYYFDMNGYFFFDKITSDMTTIDADLIANCQRYYLLAHTVYTHGIILMTSGQYDKIQIKNKINIDTLLLLKILVGAFVISYLFGFLGSFSAIRGNIANISFMAISLAVLFSLQEKKYFTISISLFLVSFVVAVTSGSKSSIIVSILFLLLNLSAKYKKTSFVLGLCSIVLFSYIPTLTTNMRKATWHGAQGSAWEAIKLTYEEAISEEEATKLKIKKDNWQFLINRVSEIAAFTLYTQHVPKKRDFYGMEIIQNGFMGLIPYQLRTDGLSIDKTAMERAYEAGALDRFIGEGGTSAKPATVADMYMIGGEKAIIFFGMLYGLLAGFFARKCEEYFGGYTSGCVLVYNSCFTIFWSGSCTENMFSAIFYGIISLFILYYLAKRFIFVKEADEIAEDANQYKAKTKQKPQTIYPQ